MKASVLMEAQGQCHLAHYATKAASTDRLFPMALFSDMLPSVMASPHKVMRSIMDYAGMQLSPSSQGLQA